MSVNSVTYQNDVSKSRSAFAALNENFKSTLELIKSLMLVIKKLLMF